MIEEKNLIRKLKSLKSDYEESRIRNSTYPESKGYFNGKVDLCVDLIKLLEKRLK